MPSLPHLVEPLASKIRDVIGVRACFGEPILLETKTVIPISLAVAAGGLAGNLREPTLSEEEGAGLGGVAVSVPIGYLYEDDGRVRFHPVVPGPWLLLDAVQEMLRNAQATLKKLRTKPIVSFG